MRKIMRVFSAALCFLMLFNFSSAAEEKTWEDVFFLKADGRDMGRLLYAIDESSVQKDMTRILKEENASVDYSKAYIYYTFSLEDLLEYYLEGNTNLGYDGLPDVCYRQIHLPIFRDGEIIGQFQFGDFTPYDERPDFHLTTTPNDIGGYLWMEYDGAHMNITYADSWEYAEMGYDAVSAKGANIQSIFCFGSQRLVFKTDKSHYYVYPAYNTEEPEKGNQAMLLEEFVRASNMGQISYEPVFVTPEPTSTPTPTPTPRPSKTAAATSRPTDTVSAAASSAEQTASPMLTAAASILLSPSAESNSSSADAAFIVLGVILCCAAAGGIVWAVMSARRKKAGK